MTAVYPKLRPDIVEHSFEEKNRARSIILEDPVANKYFRISPYEMALLKVLDGKLSLEDAVQKARLHGRHFTPEHATRLVEQFSRAGLLLGTPYSSSRSQTQMINSMRQEARARSALKLFYLYVPLINPDRFLEKTLWLWRLIVNRFTGILFLLFVPGALYLLIAAIPRISDQFLYFFNFENLFVLWIAIAIVKLVHEFSHAYTAKSLGLRVPEMGLAFLMFFPCLYCNTTAAWELADRNQRMAISLAGIFAEIVIALFSLYIWHLSEPGLLNSVAFFLAAISVASSLFFNGNPLLKFDGYFALIDLLRLPNLQSKSFGQMRYLFLNGVLGIESVRRPSATLPERWIFTTYGFASLTYRFFLYTAIVAGVYLRFDKTIGVMLGALAFTLLVVRPIVRSATTLHKQRAHMDFRPKGVLVFVAIVAAIVFLVTVPWSSKSVYPCYLKPSKVQQIVIPAEAPVVDVLVRLGDRVQAGQTILKLDPRILEHKLKDKETELRYARTEIAIIENGGKNLEILPIKYIGLSQIQDAIRHIKEDLSHTEWKAPFAGAVIKLLPTLQPGAAPGKGAIVGELASEKECQMTGLVPENEVARVQPGHMVDMWLPIDKGKLFPLTITEVTPFKTEDLEGLPFSSRFGGEIATEGKEQQRRDVPLEPLYLCSADLPPSEGMLLGMTGRLVVHQPPKSALRRVVDAAYQTFHREILF